VLILAPRARGGHEGRRPRRRGDSRFFGRSSSSSQAAGSEGRKQPRSKRASFASQKSVQLVPGDDLFAHLQYLAVKFSDVEDEREHVVENGKQGQLPTSF
jgi:hypothetical protein